jgi:hypothetical protein
MANSIEGVKAAKKMKDNAPTDRDIDQLHFY